MVKEILSSARIIPMFFLGIFILGISILPKNEFNEECLNKNTTTTLKGFFAIVILFVHVSSYTKGNNIFIIDQYGIASIGIVFFYFISGYGLIKQYLSKEKYIDTFISKKVIGLVIPYIIATFIFYLFYKYRGDNITIKSVLNGIVTGDPIVSFSWYIIEIILFNFIFYFFIKLFKNVKIIVLSMIATCILLRILFVKLDFPSSWYSTIYAFPLGMLFSLYENKLIPHLKKYYYLYLCISIFVFMIFISIKGNLIIIHIAFLMLMVLFCLKIKINSTFYKYLGSISFEFYMYSGLSIKFVRSFICFGNEIIDILCIIVFNIVLSSFIHFSYLKLMNKIMHSHNKNNL